MRLRPIIVLMLLAPWLGTGCEDQSAAPTQNAAVTSQPHMVAHFIDVGQGDATLLEFPRGAVLLDAGAQDGAHRDRLVAYLREFFERRQDLDDTLESVIVTHNHVDHTNALRAVVEGFTVKRLVDNGLVSSSGSAALRWVRDNAHTGGRDILVREVLDAEIAALGHRRGLTDGNIDPISGPVCDPRIVVLSGRLAENPGWSLREFRNDNNHSLVIRVEFGESSFLFTGDLEEEAIETMIGRYSGNREVLDVDAYQVGHHGSYNGTTAGLLEAMSPDIAVISVGNWDYGLNTANPFTTWRFGHPRLVTVELLSGMMTKYRSTPVTAKLALGPRRFTDYRVTKRIYATAWDGSVRVRAKPDGKMRVYTQN